MVVVKHGPLPAPGKQYKVYLNEDRVKQKWYLRVTHTYPNNNQHFRAGTYNTKEEALEALKSLNPIYPKKGRSKRGTVDQYANGMWRVRVKHRGEHMHVGYFKDKAEAEKRLKEALSDVNYLDQRYYSLLAKRKRKREIISNRPDRDYEYVKEEEDPLQPKRVKRQFDDRSERASSQLEQFYQQQSANQITTTLYYPQVNNGMNQVYQQHMSNQQAQMARQKRELATAWNVVQNRLFPGSIATTYSEKTGTVKTENDDSKIDWCGPPIIEADQTSV